MSGVTLYFNTGGILINLLFRGMCMPKEYVMGFTMPS